MLGARRASATGPARGAARAATLGGAALLLSLGCSSTPGSDPDGSGAEPRQAPANAGPRAPDDEAQPVATTSATRRAIADARVRSRPEDSQRAVPGASRTRNASGSGAASSSGAPRAATPLSPRLVLRWLDGVESAEDGRGGRSATTRALAFDVDAASVRAGAHTPELRVGERVLTQSVYPRPGVLRFALAAAPEEVAGAEVTLGSVGAAERVLLTSALEVPR